MEDPRIISALFISLKMAYYNVLINIADIEKQTQERFERIVEQMKQAQGITEQLKAENQMEWVARMNNIQACAREIVDKGMIYQ